MKKALLAAVAVVGVSAWTAPAAFAQNWRDGRGHHERSDRDGAECGDTASEPNARSGWPFSWREHALANRAADDVHGEQHEQHSQRRKRVA